MENAEKITEKEGLKIIYDMIEAARCNVKDNYFYYLLWGILVLLASLLEYVLLRFFQVPWHYVGWPVLMGIGLFASILYAVRKHGRSKSTSYVGHFFLYFFIGWTLSLLLLLSLIISAHHSLIQPVSLSMYALALFVSGGILRFRPLIIGSVIAWVAAIGSFLSPYPVQLLITAATTLIAYIIPGWMLKRKYEK